MDSGTLLAAEITRFSYQQGTAELLHNISLACAEGRVANVIGQNGVGKTSLLLCCIGVYPYLRSGLLDGKVSFRSRAGVSVLSLATLEELHRHLAYVGQDPDTAMLTRTVIEELVLLRLLKGEDRLKARAKCEELASEAGLTSILNRRLCSLSQGEKQLTLALAAASANAKIAVFDEPFAMLDGESRVKLSSALSRLQKLGAGIILSSLPSNNSSVSDRGLVVETSEDVSQVMEPIYTGQPQPTHSRLTTLPDVGRLPHTESPRLAVEAVEHWFEHGWRLGPLSFSCDSGETAWIWGRNGSGKSTLLRIIAGLQKPKRGSVCLGPDRVTAACMRPARIAYVPQNPEHSFIARSVAEELALSVRATDQAQDWLDSLRRLWQEIWATPCPLDRDPHCLSFAQKKILAILSSGLGAELIVIDEPYLGLDMTRRDHVRELMQLLARSGRIVVVADHDPAGPGVPARQVKLEAIP